MLRDGLLLHLGRGLLGRGGGGRASTPARDGDGGTGGTGGVVSVFVS